VFERTGPELMKATARKKRKQDSSSTPHNKKCCMGETNTIESTLRELLASDKTAQCFEQERKRNNVKEISVFARGLREAAHNSDRPNMLHLLALVYYQCRKHRVVNTDAVLIENTIQSCTDSISNLLHTHGGERVIKLMQNGARHREFICSMLYIMRVGITYQGRQILPRVESLQQLLPMQALLPTIFNIRAKSITEGEVSSSHARFLLLSPNRLFRRTL
jgi:hypothetical protein